MAVIDTGATATLFISMAGFDLKGPTVTDSATGLPVVTRKSTVLRLQLTMANGKPPVIDRSDHRGGRVCRPSRRRQLPARPNRPSPVRRPHALRDRRLGQHDRRDPERAWSGRTSAGTGRVVTKGGLLSWPLAMAWSPEGHLLVCNGKDGRLVEVDPVAGKQIYAQWINTDQAQSPPGNGDLFGIAMTPDNTGFYYVMDDVNTLMHGTR